MQQQELFDFRRDILFERENVGARFYDVLSETEDTISYAEHIDPKKKFSICGMDYEEYVDVKKKYLKGLTYDQILNYLKKFKKEERLENIKSYLNLETYLMLIYLLGTAINWLYNEVVLISKQICYFLIKYRATERP